MRLSIGRGVGLALATTTIVLVLALPANAKVPPVAVEVTTTTPRAGEAFEITVRFWDDPADRARWPNMRRFDRLLWAVPFGTDHGSGEALAIDGVRVRAGVYRARVVLGSPGRWYVCAWDAEPCADQGPGPGYPLRLEITVLDPVTVPETPSSDPRSPEADDADPREGPSTPVATAAVVAVVLAGALGVRRSRRR